VVRLLNKNSISEEKDMQIDYRVFRKPRLKDGKRTYKWYYYYYLENGRQVQKACKKCKTRTDAESYIRKLSPLNACKDVLVKTIAETMFIPDGPHMQRRFQMGRPLMVNTMLENRHKITLIISQWGERSLTSLTMEEIGNFLFVQEKSGTWKRHFITVLREIYAEAPWYGVNIPMPILPKFAKNSKKADVFTTEELKKLFSPDNFVSQELYLLFLCALTGGLRLGEAIALRPKQIISEYKALIVDGFCRRNGERTKYNKKGTEENSRSRVVPLPEVVLRLLQEHIEKNHIGEEDLCFQSSRLIGKPISASFAEKVFRHAIENAKIERNGRKLVPHSLRFTYVTQVRRELPSEMVMKLVGHTSINMTEYYNKKVLDQTLKNLTGADAAVANLFN
jgi:integrase